MKATKEKEPTMVSVAFLQLCLLFTVTLIASNVFETKQISIGSLNITVGLRVEASLPYCTSGSRAAPRGARRQLSMYQSP